MVWWLADFRSRPRSSAMFRTREQIESSLVAAGVSKALASVLASKARPCVWLQTERAAESAIPLGATKIGGEPDLPDGMPWPERDPYPDAQQRIDRVAKSIERMRRVRAESPRRPHPRDPTPEQQDKSDEEQLANAATTAKPRPLAFIAQLDCAEIAAAGDLDIDSPSTGRLLFFYDADQQPWGFFPGDLAGWRIIHDESPRESLVRAITPQVLLESYYGSLRFDPLRCTPHPGMSVTSPTSFGRPSPEGGDPDVEAFWEWSFSVENPRSGEIVWPVYQIGGNPNEIQDSMELECQLVSSGIATRDSSAEHHPRAKAMAEGAKDWVLLAQFNSDDGSGMMWGDSGSLYVWMRRYDLAVRRFDKAWVILQCS